MSNNQSVLKAIQRLKRAVVSSEKSGWQETTLGRPDDVRALIAEVKRLSALAIRCAHCKGNCLFIRTDNGELLMTHSCWTKQQRDEHARLTAEVARLSAPMAASYDSACKAACKWCTKGLARDTEALPYLHWDGDPALLGTRQLRCTAPTIEQYAESLARRIAFLENELHEWEESDAAGEVLEALDGSV